MDLTGDTLKREHASIEASNVHPESGGLDQKLKAIHPVAVSNDETILPHDLHQPNVGNAGEADRALSNRSAKRIRSNEEVESACNQCRQRKIKCSGSRPACRFCSDRNLQCTWDGPVGEKALLQVRSACLRCHKRKAKCSGERPACRFCRDRNLECSWDVADGATRMSDLKRQLREADERTEVPEKLLEAMRNGTHEESTMLLARLRLGHSVEDMVRSIKRDPSSLRDQS